MVRPAVAAFRDVCDRMSAECPGLTAESLCGPLRLPPWLCTDRRTTASAAGAAGADSVRGGSVDCTRKGSGSADHDGAAADAFTMLPDATAPRGEEAVTSLDDRERLERPPPRPAPPPLPSVVSVASGGVLAPPTVTAAEGRDISEALRQEQESGEEEDEPEKEQEQEQEQEVANPKAVQREDIGKVSDNIDAPRPGGSARQGVEDPVERHAVDGDDEAVLPDGNEAKLEPDRHRRRQQSMGSRDSEGEAQPNHSVPFSSDGEEITPTSGDKLPVESNVVDAEGGNTLLASRPTADADVDCFTYSDGEDGSLASTPGGKYVADASVVFSPGPNASSSASPALSSRPTSLVVGVVASSPGPGDRAHGTGGCNGRGADDGGDAPSPQSKQPLHAPIGEGAISTSTSWERIDGDVEESGGDETAWVVEDKRESSEAPAVVDDGGKRKGTIVDSRSEGDSVRKAARAASRHDTAKAAAPAEREARNAREAEGRNLAGGKRGRSGADILAHAYAAVSSPTRSTSNLLGRGQARGSSLGKSFAGSVSSSVDVSPLKGEFILTSALAAAGSGSDYAGYSGGVGIFADTDGVDILAAAKAVGGDGHFADDAGVAEDLSEPFSIWLGEDRRTAHSKAALGFSADVDPRASGGGSTQSIRHPEPTLEIAAHRADSRQHCRFSEEEGCDGEGATSITNWSSQELEEELCRVREAIESRVRVSECFGRPLSPRMEVSSMKAKAPQESVLFVTASAPRKPRCHSKDKVMRVFVVRRDSSLLAFLHTRTTAPDLAHFACILSHFRSMVRDVLGVPGVQGAALLRRLWRPEPLSISACRFCWLSETLLSPTLFWCAVACVLQYLSIVRESGSAAV